MEVCVENSSLAVSAGKGIASSQEADWNSCGPLVSKMPMLPIVLARSVTERISSCSDVPMPRSWMETPCSGGDGTETKLSSGVTSGDL